MTERTFLIRHRLACVLVHVDFCFKCYERVCVNLYSVWLLTFHACTNTYAHTRARALPLSSWIYSKTGAPNQQWKYDSATGLVQSMVTTFPEALCLDVRYVPMMLSPCTDPTQNFSKMTFCDVTAAIDVRMRHRIGWVVHFSFCLLSPFFVSFFYFIFLLFFGRGGLIVGRIEVVIAGGKGV